jgi:membrane-associated phospholipid phosphatase
MRRGSGSLVCFAFVGLLGSRVAAEPCANAAPYDRLASTAENSMGLRSLALLGAAAVPPLSMIPTGVDHELRVFAQTDLGGRHALEPVTPLVPYVLAGATLVGYGVSLAFDACGPRRTQAAMLQAFVLSVAVTFSLKVAIGRQWPNGGLDPSLPDRLAHPERAREFNPFELGIAAFPSGHSATTFALAAALRAANPDAGWGVFLGYPLALGVGVGMWLGDHHWVSDIVSGALIGEAIGGAVGTAFSGESERKVAFRVWPLTSGGMMAGWVGEF